MNYEAVLFYKQQQASGQDLSPGDINKIPPDDTGKVRNLRAQEPQLGGSVGTMGHPERNLSVNIVQVNHKSLVYNTARPSMF